MCEALIGGIASGFLLGLLLFYHSSISAWGLLFGVIFGLLRWIYDGFYVSFESGNKG